MTESDRRIPLLAALLIATIIALLVSGWHPYDRLTWLMEVAPVLIALPLLVVTRARYPLTTLLYLLLDLRPVAVRPRDAPSVLDRFDAETAARPSGCSAPLDDTAAE